MYNTGMFNSKSVLVTGAASGFGYETVQKFSQYPHKFNPIYAADINSSICDIFEQDSHQHVIPLKFDVRDPKQIANIVDRMIDKTGKVDVLVNNAGVINAGRLQTYFFQDGMPTPQLRELYETNLAGPILLMNAVLRHMRLQRDGVIINVTSAAPHNRTPLRIPYTDYKAGTDEIEAVAVQRLYDWWRKHLGGDPKNVAEAIFRITEGELTNHRVIVGLDSQLTTFMHEHIPFWNEIFEIGFDAVVFPIKVAVRIEQMRKK